MDNLHNGLTNDFFRVGKGWYFRICRVRQETEHAFFTKRSHTMQVRRFSNWSKVELKVTRTDDFPLRSMNDNPQRLWNRVSRSKESCLEIFKGQLGVVVDFVKFGVAQEAVFFEFPTDQSQGKRSSVDRDICLLE
ncbi:Uncharacterised protein [Streptococcus pneumoniae]|nr:Uncharacterised protein [Streptococcus pneumoniae]CIV78182.1 Uncharacterised protein [Streptococcus pneumoniae]